MPETTLASLHGIANVVVAATAVTVAGVIALRTSQRPAARREPLGIAFGLVFLAMVSHELRTPLTAIIGYSRLLMRQVYGPLSDKQLEHQEAIFRSAQRLTDLINDLLDVSQLEAGRVEIEPRPTDLSQVTEQV